LIIDKNTQTIDNIDFNEGHIILINKELYHTSFDVVHKIRYKICKKIGVKKLKVGHGGTLDPLATGLVIVGVGKATKQMQQYQDEPKQYVAQIKFGATTPSFDKETEENSHFSVDDINEDKIKASLINNFTGQIEQRPPLFSAKKINGKRAYEHARKGDEIELKKNSITIYKSTLLSYNSPVATVDIHCSKGTYIRSIANDLGKSLNNGAYLVGLNRTASGGFSINNAICIEEFENLLNKI
jgi:tRNA pseudouridine55 synthase